MSYAPNILAVHSLPVVSIDNRKTVTVTALQLHYNSKEVYSHVTFATPITLFTKSQVKYHSDMPPGHSFATLM